jgi:hypothetical protein
MKDTFKLIEEKARSILLLPRAYEDEEKKLLREIIRICITSQRVISECE